MATRPHWLRGAMAWPAFFAFAALACGYFAFATRLSWTAWPDVTGGYTFNTMLRSLLDGRVDVDPRQVGMEAYERDGRTYTYFGLLPALLRLPLAGQLWRDWTLLSSVLAASIAALALLQTSRLLQAHAGSAASRAMVAIFAATLVLSGPGLELLGKPSVYIEVMAWAWAFSCIALSVLVPLVFHAAPTRPMLTTLAACAAAAVLTRVSTGLGLLACVFVVSVLAIHAAPTYRQRLRLAWPAALLCVCAITVCLGVNQLRWGHPLKFNDFRHYTIIQDDPSRLQRIERFGSFHPARLPYALGYYLTPTRFFELATSGAAARAIDRLFDPPEGPPASLPVTWPLWCAMGAAVCMRGRVADGPVIAAGRLWSLCASLLVAPLLILSYLYLAFRYRVEFAPALVLLAMAGCRRLIAWVDTLQRPQFAWGIVAFALVLGGLQVVHSGQAALAHGCAPWGAWTGATIGPDCRGRPGR